MSFIIKFKKFQKLQKLYEVWKFEPKFENKFHIFLVK